MGVGLLALGRDADKANDDMRAGSIDPPEFYDLVLPPLLVNMSSISLASECVTMILKIDDVIAPGEIS